MGTARNGKIGDLAQPQNISLLPARSFPLLREQ
jgi:hypothetical protein